MIFRDSLELRGRADRIKLSATISFPVAATALPVIESRYPPSVSPQIRFTALQFIDRVNPAASVHPCRELNFFRPGGRRFDCSSSLAAT